MFNDDPTDDDELQDEELGSEGSSAAHSDDPIIGDDDTGDEAETLVTKEGLKKLKEELETLKTVRRQEVAQRLKEAISYGDLSENSEYEEAKNEQAFVEGRIIDLEEKIKHAKIITEAKSSSSGGKEISIGSTVTFRRAGKDDEPEAYTIVGATEADPFAQKISNESPIGRGLLGRHKGEIISVQTPSGTLDFEILKVA
ncbi:MAG: transcription elongation factor GreA [Candidatus Peribacteraceae bacterium]|nr:transcription elongation factor GreA [Candidatus Peribacteraceae bacterium]